MEKDKTTLSSLCRFTLREEHLISDAIVKREIAAAFSENRCFEFFPSPTIISKFKAGATDADVATDIDALRASIIDMATVGDGTLKNRFASDMRLIGRLTSALLIVHRSIAELPSPPPADRRLVLVKERHGVPTLYHVSNQTTVIAHVGQGPSWAEIPTIYFGLNIFDAIALEKKRNERFLYETFKIILTIEERAIQTGYSHTEVFSPEISKALNAFVDEIIRVSTLKEIEVSEIPEIKRVRPFTARNRASFVKMLNARIEGDELNFHYERNIKAIESLERLARRYKKGGDRRSLKEVVRLLVAASGHDLHEVRNRANIVLERIFAPKEFDAPIATKFINLKVGDEYTFRFSLPAKGNYFLRIYRNVLENDKQFILESELSYFDIALAYNESSQCFEASYRFDEYGHFDFLVFEHKRKRNEWLTFPGTSGRVNVIPDVRGEIILEIFTDIHGHTGVYWRDKSGHPGLVYNENGEVIRLGRFSDIAAHLEDLKSRYLITAIYVLGMQKRGSNREDWAPEATSPSPFSPMSLVEPEPFLGGEEEFRELVKRAHELGIKVIVDVVPHLNRTSTEVPDSYAVLCYDSEGKLTKRASTDGRYGSWNDGMLLNYRMFEVWEWLTNSILTLIDRFDIDGIRFDSAHAVPIMMKRNNFPTIWGMPRDDESMLLGTIIVNDREYDHFITTGYFDCACRDLIAIPLHQYIMLNVEAKMRARGKKFFINLAECYWGHERFLARSGIIPYNSSLFKICENIIHGKADVREIYHFYDNYLPISLPEGTELLGILGNHDERRALNTFGHRGLRAAVGLTVMLSNIIMDYEGSAEGEGWKVYLDNIYVNWNSFEYASHRSVERFYREWYEFHRENTGKSFLVWANNNMVAAAIRFSHTGVWLGVFNFAEANQTVSIQFDNPKLPFKDEDYIKVVDLLYSPITGHYSYYTGKELKVSKLNTVVSYTERVKLFKLELLESMEGYYDKFLRDSFFRLCSISNHANFPKNFAFTEIVKHFSTNETLAQYIQNVLVPLFWHEHRWFLELGLKRALFHVFLNSLKDGNAVLGFIDYLSNHRDEILRTLGTSLQWHNQRGPLVFMSAEAEPFSKSGGLANVVYELPRELAAMGEKVYVITGMYRHGDEKSVKKMRDAIAHYNVTYTGKNVRFKILNFDYEVGVHYGEVDGVGYFLLDHYEFFDGLYWGITGQEKLRRRIAFARACAEVICTFGLRPHFTFTNDAYAGLFNGIVRCDHVYYSNPNFQRTTFLHIVHNGGWQYFDSYHRYENGFDLFSLFNLPQWRVWEFLDPVDGNKINCMAAGIRLADRTITVSPSYAKQIEYACDGLERILFNVIGISNAIGRDFKARISKRFEESKLYEKYYPELLNRLKSDDSLKAKIESRYPEILKGISAIREIADSQRRKIVERTVNKLLVQIERNFAVDPDIVLFTMIHRITEQKGFQLLLEASEGIFKHLGYQAIVGGAVSSGDRRGEEIAHGLYLLSQYYPRNVSVNFGFQDISVPLFSSDIFCMPSLSEPGGISQLEAFATGCLVVARATGGLRDTVFPIRVMGDIVEGNGFLFSDYSPWAYYDAMERAYKFFKEHDDSIIAQARCNAENSVYYWDTPAKNYIREIYKIKEIIRVI
ncbi:MAG: glycogen/starch synthase [Spirochaetes bacterium]|nr:glycogen/starch synthase [Spirochaetota bacterium]